LLSLAIHDLKHTTLVVFELIIIEVYGSTVFEVVGCFLNYIMKAYKLFSFFRKKVERKFTQLNILM